MLNLGLSKGEGRKDSTYWYYVYFYYPQENQIVLTWTRPEGKSKTTFAFVGLNGGLDVGHWKRVNQDFGLLLFSSENRRVKKQFEERILNKIKANLRMK